MPAVPHAHAPAIAPLLAAAWASPTREPRVEEGRDVGIACTVRVDRGPARDVDRRYGERPAVTHRHAAAPCAVHDNDEPGPAPVEHVRDDVALDPGEARARDEDEVGAVRERTVVRVVPVPVVQVGRGRDPGGRRVLEGPHGPRHDRRVHVARVLQRPTPERGVGSQVVGVARVVEGHPPPVRVDEVDCAAGAARVDHVVEGQALGRETVEQHPALVVVADDVDEPGGEAEPVAAERDAAARVAHDGGDRRDDMRVGKRHGQVLDAHDGVDAGAPDDEDVSGLSCHRTILPAGHGGRGIRDGSR